MNEQNIGITGLIIVGIIVYIVISWIIARKARWHEIGYVKKYYFASSDSKKPDDIIHTNTIKRSFAVIMIVFPLAYIMYALMEK